jgi:hypothetical protein
MDHDLDDFVGPVAVAALVAFTPTMPVDETVDRRFTLSCARPARFLLAISPAASGLPPTSKFF